MARPRKIKAAFDKRRANDMRFSTFCRRHMSELYKELGGGRVDWKTALLVFSDLKLTDEHGRALTVDTAARTWRRVRIELARKEAATVEAAGRTPSSLLPGEIAPGVRRLTSASVRGALVTEAPPARHAATAQPAAVVPPSPAQAALGSDGPAADGATEQIRSALARLGHDRVPMPKRT